jgi:hypothetical protein
LRVIVIPVNRSPEHGEGECEESIMCLSPEVKRFLAEVTLSKTEGLENDNSTWTKKQNEEAGDSLWKETRMNPQEAQICFPSFPSDFLIHFA